MRPLTTAQAAALLVLSLSQTRRLARQGRIVGATRLGRDWIFDPPIELLPPERPQGWPSRLR